MTVFDAESYDVSGASITQFLSVFNAGITSDTRTFDIYGARINWANASAMAGTATWRGYYLNADNVTCGATRFFYGLDIDMDGMTTGGIISMVRLASKEGVTAINITTANPSFSRGSWNACSVDFADDFDGTVTWGAAGTVGIKWTTTLAGGAVTQINPARGGIINLATTNVIDTPAYLAENAVRQWSLQDKLWACIRGRLVESTTTYCAIGFTDAVAAAVPYTTNALLVARDTTAVEAGVYQLNFFFLAVRGGGRTLIDTTIAADTNHHVAEFRMASNGVDVDCYFDGTLRGTFTAAQLPINTIMMQRLIFACSKVAATARQMRVDSFKASLMRNTGNGDT